MAYLDRFTEEQRRTIEANRQKHCPAYSLWSLRDSGVALHSLLRDEPPDFAGGGAKIVHHEPVPEWKQEIFL